MADTTRVLVADDNAHIRDLLNSCVGLVENAIVVGSAQNGSEALEMIQDLQPDIVLLDLIMPIVDGMGVLEQLAAMNIARPEVVVLSAVGNEDLIQQAMKLGVRYYLVKPFDMDLFARRIGDVIKKRQNQSVPGATIIRTASMHVSSTRSLDEEITSIFLTIGIPAHIKGYHFLRQAVKTVMENQDKINSITKDLYPSIGDHFKTSASKVERAIRHAIEVAWTRGRIENINQIFGYTVYTKNDKPTNSEFIALVADKLLLDHSA